MHSADKARAMSEKNRKEFLEKEWKKLKGKLKKAIKQGKTSFKVKALSYKASKKLKKKGFEISKNEEGYEVISWERA